MPRSQRGNIHVNPDRLGAPWNPPAPAPPDLNETLSRWVTTAATLQERNAQLLERLSERQLTPGPTAERIKVPTFDGERSWAVFEAQFRSIAESCNWSETEKGRRLLSALRGAAADLVQTLPPAEFENYASLSGRLCEHYGSTQRGIVAEAELERRKQKPGESLRDYAAEVQRLCRVAYPTWPEAAIQTMSRKCFLDGISDPELRRAVRLRQVSTMNETLAAALHIECVDQVDPPAAKRPRVAAVSQISVADASGAGSSDDGVETVDARRLTSQQATARPSRSRSPRRRAAAPDTRCYRCNRYGHFAYECADRHRQGRYRQRRESQVRDPSHNRTDRRGRNQDRPRDGLRQGRQSSGNDQ